jgi:competence protein ComEA
MHNRICLFCNLVLLTTSLAVWQARAAESQGSTEQKPTPSRRATSGEEKTTGQTQKVDLNMASQTELEALPGVGAATANAIIKARPFKSVNELTNVSGIGPAKFASLKSHVTVMTAKTRPPASVGKAPERQSVSGGSHSTSTSPAAPGQKINLNTASKTDLETLPGIGPVKAQAIIDARPFKSIGDVKKINGIKEGVFSQIEDKITVK